MTSLKQIEAAVDALEIAAAMLVDAVNDGCKDEKELAASSRKAARTALLALVEWVCKDAERWRWWRERVNWADEDYAYTSGSIEHHERLWTHYDVRQPDQRPEEETVDEYVDSALAATDEVQK